MAIVMPFLVLILAASAEIGYYFYEQNRLVESVRDAARYAARQPITAYSACSGSPNATVTTNARNLASKGSFDSTDPDLLWGWGQTGETFTVTMRCSASVSYNSNTLSMEGIYVNNTAGAPVVVVNASLPHQSVFATIGIPLSLTLNAQQEAAVMGI